MFAMSKNPVIDTVAKLVVVAVAMFAFVFVVMVPLYNVCLLYTSPSPRDL